MAWWHRSANSPVLLLIAQQRGSLSCDHGNLLTWDTNWAVYVFVYIKQKFMKPHRCRLIFFLKYKTFSGVQSALFISTHFHVKLNIYEQRVTTANIHQTVILQHDFELSSCNMFWQNSWFMSRMAFTGRQNWQGIGILGNKNVGSWLFRIRTGLTCLLGLQPMTDFTVRLSVDYFLTK